MGVGGGILWEPREEKLIGRGWVAAVRSSSHGSLSIIAENGGLGGFIKFIGERRCPQLKEEKSYDRLAA